MNDQEFLKNMGNIRDEYLLEALPKNKKKKRTSKYVSRIAVAVLAVLHLMLRILR